MRKLGLILAAAILPACETRSQRDDVEVTVSNVSATGTVRIQVEVDRGGHGEIDREVFAGPGEDARFRFDSVTRLALRIYRTSDNLKIFDDFWDADDLRRMHDDVFVTVDP